MLALSQIVATAPPVGPFSSVICPSWASISDGLPAETLNKLFVESAPSVEQAVAESLAEYGDNAQIAVIPKGPYVLAQIA